MLSFRRLPSLEPEVPRRLGHHPPAMFASSIPKTVQNEILARGIPESTPTIGIEKAEMALFAWQRNMQDLKPAHGMWPQRDIDFSDDGEKSDRWLHTDLMSLPHFYTYRLYQEIIEKGNLK